MRKKNDIEQLTAILNKKLAKSSNEIKCPHCGVIVSEKRFPRHLRLVHSPIKKKKISPDRHNVSNIAKKNKMVKCPHCHISILSEKLQLHIDRVHKKFSKGENISFQDVSQTEGPTWGESFQNKPDPDGSKGWHVFRDRGKFGSFPSFDPSDDE